MAAAAAKVRLRVDLRGRLARLPAAEREWRGGEIVARLDAWLAGRTIDRLLLHRSLSTEPALDRLFGAALARGQEVFAPRVDGPRLRFVRVEAETRWRRSTLGAIEPESGLTLAVADLGRGASVVVVPGLAFDERGGRLGRGGGHYDRFLREARAAGAIEAVAVAFDLQVVAEVPRLAHDEPVDAIVTETRWIRAAGGKRIS